MKNEDFKLGTEVEYFYSYAREYILVNIPNVHRDLRIKFMEEAFNLLYYIREAQFNKGNIRQKYITEMLVRLSLLDYLISEIDKYTKVNKKHIKTLLSKLASIKTMTYAWKSKVD